MVCKKGSAIFVHERSKEEFSNHRDESAKNNMLIKLNSYNILPAFTHQSNGYFDGVISKYPKDRNWIIDNVLLREVYNGNVGILLTDDTLIFEEAQELYIWDRALHQRNFYHMVLNDISEEFKNVKFVRYIITELSLTQKEGTPVK